MNNLLTHSLTAISLALIAAGTVLLGIYVSSSISAAQGSRDAIATFEAARSLQQRQQVTHGQTDSDETLSSGRPEAHADVVRFGVAVSSPDLRDWSAGRIEAYEKIRNLEHATDVPEAILRIPSIDLEVPVFYGVAEINLTRGAGRIDGTPPFDAAGNTGLAAHRDGYFRALKDVVIGDAIEVVTPEQSYNYRITELLVVNPEDVYVLDPTDSRHVTLVTCYPFYFIGSAPQRFVVRAAAR